MERFFRVIGYTVLSCASLLVLFFVLFWIHMQLRIDTRVVVEAVSRKLHVSPDKLSILNEPRGFCPVVICKYLNDRTNLLNRCESIIPSEEDMKSLTEKTKNEILSMSHREFDRIEKKARREFEIYGIGVEEPIERLYYITGGAIGNPVVVETKECLYVLCHINSM